MINPLPLIRAIRESHPGAITLYTAGHCYDFYLILRSVFPDAEPYYSMSEGHVYSRIGGHFYDIRGKRLAGDRGLEKLDVQRCAPHRWASRSGLVVVCKHRQVE